VTCVGENETDLEVLRPIGALHAKRRIESVRERFNDEIPLAIRVDGLEESREIELQDLGIDPDNGKRLLDEVCIGRRQERIIGETQREARSTGPARVARLVK
jgi:hypothetical protein